MDEGRPEEQFGAAQSSKEETVGALQPIAARVRMKILYAAGVCRFGLLRPTCALATYITRWAPFCDRRLRRLLSYISSTLNLHMVAYVADKASDLQVVFFQMPISGVIPRLQGLLLGPISA